MSPTLTRWLLAATATGALVAALAVPAPDGYGQEKADTVRGEPVSTTVHCQQCHTLRTGPGFEAYERQKRTEFIRFGEYQTWHDEDLHSTALANITPDPKGGPDGNGNLAWRMQSILSQSPSRKGIEKYQINQADECLACHAVDTKPRPVAAGAMNPGRFHTDAGVGCEACHGLVAAEWIGVHIDESWRKRTPQEKTKYHQVDLRDPYTRALQCASCHVGNKSEGKFVTHEMYAAGHPPLPPFEVVTFARDAPRHYYTHRDPKNVYLNTLARQSPDVAWRNFHYRLPATKDKPDGECPEARALALGSVATFEASMNLLAKDAADTPKDQLLDFAHFDCYACHHDLKVPSWRQARGYRGVPGRPTMKPWATEVLRAVLDHAKSASGFKTEEATKAADQMRQALAALNKQFDARPFGDPAAIAKEAAAFGPPLQELRTALNDDAAVYTPAQTEALYRVLADRLTKGEVKAGADGLYLDHDAAQQAVWALNALRTDLRAARGEPDMEESPAVTALNAITELRVRPVKREPVAPERLKTRLEHIAAFDPGTFLPEAREWVKEK